MEIAWKNNHPLRWDNKTTLKERNMPVSLSTWQIHAKHCYNLRFNGKYCSIFPQTTTFFDSKHFKKATKSTIFFSVTEVSSVENSRKCWSHCTNKCVVQCLSGFCQWQKDTFMVLLYVFVTKLRPGFSVEATKNPAIHFRTKNLLDPSQRSSAF